jgi:hypothetical protein
MVKGSFGGFPNGGLRGWNRNRHDRDIGLRKLKEGGTR